MKNEIVGEGTYGCVIKPALKCDKDTNITKKDYDNRLSKVMRKSDAIEELEEMKKIQKIDGIEKFTIREPIYCKPELNARFNKIVKDCETKRVKDYYRYFKDDLRQLVIDDGGIDVYKFYKNVLPVISKEEKNIFFTSILHLFKGLKFFSDNDIVHRDIKTLNIVYNIKTAKIRYIDFGMVISKKEFIRQSRINKNRHAQSWSYYPPEYSCANNNTFKNQKKCSDYKSEYVNSYSAFINDIANSFDSYCLCLSLKSMIGWIKADLLDYKDFLKEFGQLMRNYSDKDLIIRSKDINQLINNYKNLLNKYNIYSTKAPTPSQKSIEIVNKLSLEILEKKKDQTKEKNLIRCPPSMPEFNPFTRKCVKKCKDGKIRNDKFRCVQNKTKKKKSVSHKYDEITKNTDEVNHNINKKMRECTKDNKDYNPLSGRCVKKCKENQKRILTAKQYKCVAKHPYKQKKTNLAFPKMISTKKSSKNKTLKTVTL